MLEQLNIEQLAIIQRSQIRFQPGFNVLSGETGAGKSILIDALSLLLGARADSSSIRHGADKAQVIANFIDNPEHLAKLLNEEGLDDLDDPQGCLIRRTVRESASKAYLNDHPVTAAKLKGIGAHLVSIHGQHANQTLVKSDEQRRRLDRFAGHRELLDDVNRAYGNWQKLERAWQDWQQQRSDSEERLNLLAYQLEELNELAPQENEFEQLSAEQNTLASVDSILEHGSNLGNLLQDNDESINALLRHARQLSEKLAEIDDRFSETYDMIEQSLIHADEAYDALHKRLSRIEHDPEQLANIEARMSALHSLARKHHCTPDELYSHWQALQHEYENLQRQSNDSNQLDDQRDAALQHYNNVADKLSNARQKAAATLSKEVEGWIRQLGMQRATFAVDVRSAERPAAHGQDDVNFLLCANPGQTLQPLSKVASGGELSRVSLAIEVSCLDEAPVPTIIFDEIDAGIGGEVADTVGSLLHRLSHNRQVLCITHLPQVAAYADHHYLIEKSSDDTSTQTRVTPLDEDTRIIEIARMLGSADSATSREHARAMLNKRPG